MSFDNAALSDSVDVAKFSNALIVDSSYWGSLLVQRWPSHIALGLLYAWCNSPNLCALF